MKTAVEQNCYLNVRVTADLLFAALTAGGVSALTGGWRLLAIADAAYTFTDIVFAVDQYNWDVSGDGILSQEMHTIWAGAGFLIGGLNGVQLLNQFTNGVTSTQRLRAINSEIAAAKSQFGNSTEYVNHLNQLKDRVVSSRVAIANSDAIPSANSLEYDAYRNYVNDLSAAEVALDEALRWGVQAETGANLPRVISTQVIPSIDGNLPANSFALFSGPSFDNNLLRNWYVGPITIDASGDFILNTIKQKWSPSPRDNLRGVRNGYVYDTGNPGVKREVELQLYRNTNSGKIEYFAKSIAGVPLDDVQLYNICQRYGLRFDDLPSNVSDFIQNYPVDQFDDFIAALDDVDANIPDGVTDLFADIASHPDDAYRAVFLNGDGVRVWESFKIHGDDLITDVPSLTKLSNDLADNPNLHSYLDDVDNFRAYKAYPSSNINALDAVKGIQGQGKLFNDKFNFIDNPGCIGHLDLELVRNSVFGLISVFFSRSGVSKILI